MEDELPFKVQEAIDGRKDSILEDLLWCIEHQQITDITGCHRFIDESPHDDCAAMDLDLEDKLSIVEIHGADYGHERFDVSVDDFRTHLEGLAAQLVCSLGEGAAKEAFTELEELMEEHDIQLEDVRSKNSFGWARHFRERDESDKCQVYEYRNVEGEIHVDVWEYRIGAEASCVLLQWRDAEDLTPEERLFDAT